MRPYPLPSANSVTSSSLCYQLRSQRLRNLPSVEAAILDKNLVGAGAGNNDAGQVDAGDVAFKRHRIAYRLLILSFKTHAHALKKAEVWMVAGEREDKVVLQRLPAMGGFDDHCIGCDFDDVRVKQGLHFPVLDAVFYVGLDPVLHVAMHLRTTMNERDARAAAPQLKGRDGSRVFAADHHHIHFEKRMRIVVVVVDLAQVLAGNAHVIGQIVVAGGNGEFARLKRAGAAEPVFGVHREGEVCAAHPLDQVVLVNVELVIRSNQPVILQRLITTGLGVGTGKRNVADLQQLGGGKERHVRRVMEQRVADAAFVDHDDAQAGFLSLNGAGEAGGAGTDD